MVTEDFETAFEERAADAEALGATGRLIFAMHAGGIAVECLLKAILVDSLPENKQGVKEWKTDTNDPGHAIERPGHHYLAIVGECNMLMKYVKRDYSVLKWLNEVENPLGNFINMRYLGRTILPSDVEKVYQRWRPSYLSLVGWLQKQRTELAKQRASNSPKRRKGS